MQQLLLIAARDEACRHLITRVAVILTTMGGAGVLLAAALQAATS
jgi:hypothetical protein